MLVDIPDFFTTIKDEILIYTDGACRKNPGPGGFASIFVKDDTYAAITGFEENTTNNRMEMMAAIEGLRYIFENHPSLKISIYTDSQYLKDGITVWMKKWRQNNWKTSTGNPVKNQDLWMKLDEFNQKLALSWHWVKGHAGNHYNEIADTLARNAIIGGVVKG